MTHIFKGFCDLKIHNIGAKWKAILASLLCFSSPAKADKDGLVILTTFSGEPLAELISEYKTQYPKVDITLIYRKTQSASQLLNKGYIDDIDMVLSSSPYVMQDLVDNRLLSSSSLSLEMPVWLSPFVLPTQNKVVSVGYSGAGLVWNNDYLTANNLSTPSKFKDLVSPEYYGHITMSTPSRSGTTQMMVESILARYGWEKGWSIILNVGANLGTISSRSFGVSDYVAKGQFGIGPTIDSYALVLPERYQHVGFGYDQDFTLMPTYVAILNKPGGNPLAHHFIELLVSEKIQGDMLESTFAKHSISDNSLLSEAVPALNLTKLMGREKLVNLIFDESITKRLPELQDIWLSLSRFKVQYKNDAEIQERVNTLMTELFTIPFSEEQVEQFSLKVSEAMKNSHDTDRLKEAMLAEFSYRFGVEYEANIQGVELEFRQMQQELTK